MGRFCGLVLKAGTEIGQIGVHADLLANQIDAVQDIYFWTQSTRQNKNYCIQGHVFHQEAEGPSLESALRIKTIPASLSGSWAFAYYDENRNEIFLSRDRIGAKTLYYIDTAKSLRSLQISSFFLN